MRAPRESGFTLIELVIVVVLTGILATITAVFIVEPMRAYVDQSRRAGLVDDAENALRRMGRDIRAAVPNSVRVLGAGQGLQLYNAVSGARYRTTPREDGSAVPPDDAEAILQFDRADDSFDVLGAGFPAVPALVSSTHVLVIYNLGTPDSDVYQGSGSPSPVVTPAGTRITIAGSRVTLDPPFQFGWESPQQRVFLSDGAVTYACDLGAGTLSRAAVVVTSNVTGCNFTYTPGTATRSALATMSVTLSRDGESVTLLRQVHVENLP